MIKTIKNDKNDKNNPQLIYFYLIYYICLLYELVIILTRHLTHFRKPFQVLHRHIFLCSFQSAC
jgi:hypothetical protein